MPPPTITIVHYAAPPTIGGVESTIADHARLFADHGYQCQVVAGSGQGLGPRVPVHILPEAGTKSRRTLEINMELAAGQVSEEFQSATRELSEQLSTQIPTGTDSVVIVHNALSLHKNLVLTAALDRLHRQKSFRLIAWCHDFAWTDQQYKNDVHPGYPWDLLKEPWPDVDYVVVSEARRRELTALWRHTGLQSSHEHPVKVIPPGIDPIEFLGVGPQTAEWAKQFGLLDSAPLLLLPARLTRRKRVEFAIEIIDELCNLGMKAKLVITGPPGPHNPKNKAYLEQLEKQAAKLPEHSVILLHRQGAVSREIMRDLYLLSDALLFPSEREGFGIPLLEAGLTRLPVFCSDIEPFREIARERVHYIRAEMSARAAAELIVSTLAQDSAYSLKRRVLEQFAWERIFKEHIEPLVR